MRFVHPFTPIIETKDYPHARSYRTGFIEKIMDTFDVFSGGIPGHNGIINKTDEDIYGIFDYLTIGLLFWLTKTVKHKSEGALSSLPMMGWGTLFVLLSIPRYLFATIMTLICLPIIGIVNIITKTKSDDIKQSILNYEIQDDTPDSATTLKALLQQRKCPLEDSQWSLNLDDKQKPTGISLVSLNTTKQQKSLTLFFDKPNDKKLFQGLRELNINNLQTRIENDAALNIALSQ